MNGIKVSAKTGTKVDVRINRHISEVPVVAIVFSRIGRELVVALVATHHHIGLHQEQHQDLNFWGEPHALKQLVDSETDSASRQCPTSEGNLAVK